MRKSKYRWSEISINVTNFRWMRMFRSNTSCTPDMCWGDTHSVRSMRRPNSFKNAIGSQGDPYSPDNIKCALKNFHENLERIRG
jgi:hypothetical protein